ncbi:MAG: 50S ribosomal protein L15 [Elusimicrobia bacterium]|nr:50S ribosomal protein L15 [Elusimicrobiota bacterium]
MTTATKEKKTEATEQFSIHTLVPKHGARKARKRLGTGSGSGHGQTSTRGQKGQRGRAGDGKQTGFEGGQTPLFRRVPKRGFTNGPFRVRYQVVDLADLARVFGNAKEVGVDALKLHRLVKGSKPVKVLGDGELKHPLKVQAHAFSESAKKKIEKAGGTAEVVAAPK